MRLVFMGTPRAAVPTLEGLLDEGHEILCVYTQPDRPSGRGQSVTPPPVKAFALDRGLDIRQPLKIRTDEAYEEFRSLNAEAVIVVAYGRILPERWLVAFPQGAINVHFSLLPKYRGAAPINWAIANGEVETGVTTMRMDAGLDTGDVLLQKRVTIASDENAVDLMDRLAVLGADLLRETLMSLDQITPRPQDDSAATFAPIMKKEDGLIDWTRSAKQIVDRIRGFQPFPTSFTYVRGSRLTLWRAVAEDGNGHPGEIVKASGGELVVGTGHGSLRVIELQPEGKRRLSARDYINGAKITVGERLGA